MVTIAGDRAFVEGGTARFTLTKTPATGASVTVNLAVSQDGDWGASGPSTLKFSGGTGYYFVTTTNDEAYDNPGTVTATLEPGYGPGSNTRHVVTNPGTVTATLEPGYGPGSNTRHVVTNPGTVTATLEPGYGYRVGAPASADAAVTDTETAPRPPLEQFALVVTSFYDRITANHVHGNSASGALNKRFLKTMGHPEYVDYPQPVLTVADAEGYYNHGGPGANKAWEGAPEAIQYKLDFDGTVDPPPPVTEPELTISGGPPIVEGGTATFTITADPAPADPITVNMDVDQDGSWGASGDATITVSAATTTYTITTVDDDVFEPHGSVTAKVKAGTGYTVDADSAAAVKVSNNDLPPPATPKISITAGSAITEGQTATFTISADPAPTSPTTVNIDASQDGSWGATGPSTVSVSGATATYTITTSDDSQDELDGSVTATLKSGAGYTLGSASSATVNLSDDDFDDTTTGNADTLEVKFNDAAPVKRGQTLRFKISLSEAAQQTVEISYFIRFHDMSTPTGPDTGLLTIPIGADHGYINIQVPANTELQGSRPRVRTGMEDIRGAQAPSWTDGIAYGRITG